ncbi:MAG: ABC transporter permease [Vicinamibacteria bacterium]
MVRLPLALRTLVRAPLVTAVAVLSLALGIGANAAIFSLFDQMLLRPLPVPEPKRLVNLSAPGPKPGSQSSNNAGRSENIFSYPMFRDLERQQQVLTGLAAHRSFGANLAFRDQTLSGEGMLVSGSYFPVLGVRPALGRLLTPEDDAAPGAGMLAVLSHDFWRTRFDESAAVVGESLVVNGQLLTIVGVAPPGFLGTTLGSRPQVFVPISLREALTPGWKVFDDRRAYWAYLFGRLKPGVSFEQAQAALDAAYGSIVREVEAPLQKGMSDETLARFKAKKLGLAPGARGQSSIHREARAPLMLLFAVTGLVLAIACANVANLLLARGAARAGEMAVRLSIGASRRQLVGQLLAESCLLGLLGGAAGLLTAYWSLKLIVSMLPADPAAVMRPEISGTVLAFTALLAVGTGLAFGLFPALDATRLELATTLKGQAGQPGGSRAAARFRSSLATTQIALSMALLVSAGLFTRSLANVSRVDLGLKTEGLATFAVSPELSGYAPEQSRAFFERLEEELGALPGVTGVAGSMVPLVSGSNWGNSVSVEGFDAGPDTDTHSSFNQVGPGFFRTMAIPLLRGREFTRADGLGAPKVAIVNQAFARKFGLGEDVVGRRMSASRGRAATLDIEIVGLARDARYSEVKDAPPPQYYLPYRQDERIGALSFYVRAELAPEALLAPVGTAIARLDARLPVDNLRTFETQVRENVFVDRLISTLCAAFAVLATLLAAVGLYGVLAYTVAQRTREIGVRMALGADASRVRGMLLAQVGRMTLVGGLLGLVAAVALGRAARALLYGVEGHDPLVLAGAAMALAAVALGAGLVPVQRAARIDPMRALHYE